MGFPPNDCNGSYMLCLQSCPGCIDSCALVTFWCELNEPATLDSWNSSLPYSKWPGVKVNSTGSVTELCLNNKALSGPLPAIIAEFKSLQKLDLSDNFGLSGNVQPSFLHLNKCQNLDYLNLSGTLFDDDLGNLSNKQLSYLNLNGCPISGQIPDDINDIAGLCFLDLGSTQIGGPIPDALGELNGLTYLNLSGTTVSMLPSNFSELKSSLEYLDLSSCKGLAGPFPAQISELTNLKCLDLSDCLLEGSIPSNIENLTTLSSIYLDENLLSGCIDSLGGLCSISNLAYNFDQAQNFATPISNIAFEEFCDNGVSSCCPSLSPIPSLDTTVCEGSTLILTSGGPTNSTYWITPNDDTIYTSDLTINPLMAIDFGKYYVVADDGNCSSVKDSVLVNEFPNTTAAFTSANDPNNNLTLVFTNASTNYDSLRWDFGDGNTSTLVSPSHTYADNGLYDVCLTAYGECADITVCETTSLGTPQPTMVLVPYSPDFVLGCFSAPCEMDEMPNGQTAIDSFRISSTEVTQAQYQSIMGNNPSQSTICSNCPVETVSWFDAILFCNRLSSEFGLENCYFQDADFTTPYDGSGTEVWWDTEANGYRLPTEAEWEHSAKGGTPPDGTLYAGNNVLDDVAWHLGNSGGMTHETGTKAPVGPPPGISDMTGNVAEWCWGIYGPNDYQNSPACNPLGNIGPGTKRVIRGGSWNSKETDNELKVFNRSSFEQAMTSDKVGFRLARNAGN